MKLRLFRPKFFGCSQSGSDDSVSTEDEIPGFFFWVWYRNIWSVISQMFIGCSSWCILLIFSKSWVSSTCHCRPAA